MEPCEFPGNPRVPRPVPPSRVAIAPARECHSRFGRASRAALRRVGDLSGRAPCYRVMQGPLAFILFAAVPALLPLGCGGQSLPPSEQAAIQAAVTAHYAAQDKEAKATVHKIAMSGPTEARVTVKLKYPSFHSVATQRMLMVKKQNSKWVGVREVEK